MVSQQRTTTTIDGVTYDITDFLDRHPGGSDMLIMAANRDATVMFYSYHRNIQVAKNVLKNLPVVGGQSRLNQIDTLFYNDIKARVNLYFTQTNQSSRGTLFMWLKSLALILLTILVYYFSIVRGFWIVCPLLGWLMAMNGLAIQHDANHGSFSKYIWLNRLAGFVDDIIGGSSLIWRHQHVIIHHAYPNHHELDGDTFSKFPLVRFNPKLPIRWYLRFQWLYAPLVLYSLMGISYTYEDILCYLSRKYLFQPLQPLRKIDHAFFWIGKLLHCFFFLILPIYFHGWSGIWLYYLNFELFGSNMLASLFAVSHNTEETAYNISETSDWAEMQIRTSANWSVHSWQWWLISGGLNYQIEHHLFPAVSHVHYPAISKIVQQVCKENNIPYNSYPTFTEIYLDHIRTLKKLSYWKEE
jgi:fatty acid desaturase